MTSISTYNTPQQRLAEILRGKGIGPQGSKSLSDQDCRELPELLLHNEVSLTTKATILTALLLLDANTTEQALIDKIKQQPEQHLPRPLQAFFHPQPEGSILYYIQQLIQQQSLEPEEAQKAMALFFDPDIPEHQKASFLEGERLKRESFAENFTFLDSMWQRSRRVQSNLPCIIDLADGYDGCTRTPSYTPFLAALLGSAGYPTLVHSVDKVAPKEGITSHAILQAAGKNPLYSPEQILEQLQDPAIGWGHTDQSLFFPELYALKQMRREMVKRPFLATFEKLLQPVRARTGNLIVTGYTHKHYREELVKLLREQGQCAQALVLKGAEGSTQLRMDKASVAVLMDGREIHDSEVHPENYELPVQEYSRQPDISVEACYKEGLAALEGQHNEARNNLLYTGAVMLEKFGLLSSQDAVTQLSQCLDQGRALKHWNKALKNVG